MSGYAPMTTPPSDEVVVWTQGVEQSFGQGERVLHVLRGVDLAVRTGEVVALYGPSGSGKTTFLNIVGALDRPNAGEVRVCGVEVQRAGESARARLRRRKIGFIFQSYTLLPTYSALENIELTLRLPGLGYFERRRRAHAALEAVGLKAWADHVPEELSGGQVQRVAIARALALRPALILADEPTSGLDTRTASRILQMFREIAQVQGTAFLIATHDLLLADYVDTTYDIIDGRLVCREPSRRKEEATHA